ncbi:unnamed protein product [Durusdinium trenchii]|uniref:Uncharacterized protein n=1 Tax=Durusdinium trenchii TaxID=1381693 RepID=A0ABP0N4B0_9DINO
MLKFHGTFSGVTALALALAEEECHGVLAGPECCEVEDLEDHQILQKPWRDQILQDNMVKFGKVGGDGSHRYESSLNPALCERDLQDLRAENPNFFAPRGHAARREAFEACARRNARLVELHVDLEMAGDCSMHYVGDFCSPFSCAVVYEKWILSAQYFIENFPQCATFALQPCIWQNAAQMHRVSSLQQLPELFEALELTLDTDLERDKEVQTLLTTLENLSDDLLPWPLLRPFADAAALGRKRLRLSRPPQKLLESGIPVILDLLAPAIQTLLCEEMGCQPFLDESLLAGATRLRPRWRELGSLCAAGQFQRAAELERRYAGETERWVAALAQLGHDVPPDFLLSFQELCNLLGRSHASPTRSPLSRDICGESTVPAVEPTGCSCRAEPVHCFQPRARLWGRRVRRAVVAAFDLQIPLDEPYRTWGVHDAPLDFLMNFDLSLTPGETDRVLLLPRAHLALYPLTTRTRRRLQGAKVKVIEVPWIEPPGVSPTVAQRNQENHFGNREYIRLHAMNLDYDVVVYLDTDVRIVGDLNPIFEEGQDLFVSTGSTVAPLDGGFFAVRPSGALFRAMLDVLRTVHYDRETGWNRMGHGYSLALGRAEGNYPAGPQGFLYHFFYMADPAVDLALKRNGAVRPRSAQVDSCQWNYNSFHGSFKWRYLDESSYFAAMPEEWRRQVESFHRRVTWTFPCDFTVKKPVLVHHMDEAIEGYLEHLQQQHPNQTTVLLPRKDTCAIAGQGDVMDRLKRLWQHLVPAAVGGEGSSSSSTSAPRKVWYAPYKFEAYGEEEIAAVTAALRDGWLAPGPRTDEFEAKVSELFGKRFGVMVNSGSSGNIIGLAALGLQRGDEVITPACTFATCIAPMEQLGLTPVFIDVIPNRYDSCDTITYTAESDVSVISFYAPWTEFGRRSQDASHIITAGGLGGCDMSERFGHSVDGIEYDFKFLYGCVGWNMKACEMNAAFGLAQLKKLEHFKVTRCPLTTELEKWACHRRLSVVD